jgi:hypothetical protein
VVLAAVAIVTDELGAKAVYYGGDLVGYGPHPNEVCELIEQRGIPTIYGNHDYAIARNLEDCGCAPTEARLEPNRPNESTKPSSPSRAA